MMKLDKFIKQLTLAYQQPTVYKKGGWGKWNGSKFEFDCVCYIKSILWGWNNERSGHGGAKYASNGVPDIGTEKIISVCKNVSTDFSNIQIGELVWMSGHVGIYVGNGNVLEATTGWNTKKVIMSQIDKKGNRTYNNHGGSKPWKKHGFLPYVDYSSNDSKPTTKWTAGKYRLLYAKAIRKTHLLGNNIIKAQNCTAVTKKVLTSTTGNAMIKAGTTITITEIYVQNGRIWGKYGNCWIVLCNVDGTPQAKKVD